MSTDMVHKVTLVAHALSSSGFRQSEARARAEYVRRACPHDTSMTELLRQAFCYDPPALR